VTEPDPGADLSPSSAPIDLPEVDSIVFGECLGSGHFSHVYAGTYQSQLPVAVKVIERGSERTVQKEIDLLVRLRGKPHIIQLYEVIRSEQTLLVFELLQSLSADDFYASVTVDRFRHILRCLLLGLYGAHSIGIIHRDVKLGNILISPDWQEVRLADWGCGCEIAERMSYRAGSRPYRSIEMLLHYEGYGTCADMWAVGAFIFTVLCGGDCPWRCPTGWETVVEIASFVGRRAVVGLARKYGTELPEDVFHDIYHVPRRKFRDCFAKSMRGLRNKSLIDLMEKLLAIQMEERLTAEEALAHPFFRE
jgi:casein kinase II subunit alpha